MIDIIAVTYNHGHRLNCFIESILSQTNKNYKLFVIHDGPDEQFSKLNYPGVNMIQHPQRMFNYGHQLRDWALQNVVQSEYVLITNGDNYYTPNMVEEVLKRNEDIIYFDFIHHHDNPRNENKSTYGFMKSKLEDSFIDMGSVVVRSKLAKLVGFKSLEMGADWIFFNQILKLVPSIHKIDKVLFVHN